MMESRFWRGGGGRVISGPVPRGCSWKRVKNVIRDRIEIRNERIRASDHNSGPLALGGRGVRKRGGLRNKPQETRSHGMSQGVFSGQRRGSLRKRLSGRGLHKKFLVGKKKNRWNQR